MRPRALAGIVAIAALTATAPAAGAACSVAGRSLPGAGRLEWKPTGWAPLRTRGLPGIPVARTGSTLILSSVTSIDGRRRHGLAAVNMRTGRVLPFDPDIPSGRFFIEMAASPTTVYVGVGTFDEGREGLKEIKAFDLRTGAPLPAFAPPDFVDGLLGGMVFAGGRLIMAGAPPFGAGTNLGAYDPTTGAPVWSDQLDWSPRSLVTDGTRLFVGEEPPVPDSHGIKAYEVATGAAIPGWGATLPARTARTTVFGVDATHVFAFTGSRQRAEMLTVSQSDGRRASLRRLPSNAVELREGTRRTIYGRIRVQPRGGGPKLIIGAVFDTTGKLIGTVCSRYQVLAQIDDRHLLASETLSDQRSARIVELVRPRR
jgi:hypothetical protein